MRYCLFVLMATLVSGCASRLGGSPGKKIAEGTPVSATPVAEQQLTTFIDKHVATVAPLEKALNLASWDATTTGKAEQYDKAATLELAIRKVYGNPEEYRFLKQLRASDQIKDSLLKRELEVLFLSYEQNQIDPALLEKITLLSTEVQKTFNDFRATVGGRQVTDNDISRILKEDLDSNQRKEAWEAYQARGQLVRDKVVELAKLRNQAARQLGYANYYEMSLKLMEQDPAQIKSIFDTLAKETEAPFAQMMTRVKGELAQRYRVKPEELMPWHYSDPFFQEAPALGGQDLDTLFENVDLESLVTDFFKDSDIDPANIMAASDLYEKPGKMPHAYCTSIDRGGDIRILANLRKDEKWASTLMHEMGHAVYDKYIDPNLPWLLREASHTFTTEAIAEMFGRLTRNPSFLEGRLKVPEQKVASMQEQLSFTSRLQALVFARWALVVTIFEREMYQNPEQDLNKLWWTLKQKYQMQNIPEGRNSPDWAAKIHIAAIPVYYHNYMLGEMMASQLLHTMTRQFTGSDDINRLDFAQKMDMGKFLIAKIFRPGKSLRWDELLVQATGETLNPKYFADQFL